MHGIFSAPLPFAHCEIKRMTDQLELLVNRAGAAFSVRRCVLYAASAFGVTSASTFSPNSGSKWSKACLVPPMALGRLKNSPLCEVPFHHFPISLINLVPKSGQFSIPQVAR